MEFVCNLQEIVTVRNTVHLTESRDYTTFDWAAEAAASAKKDDGDDDGASDSKSSSDTPDSSDSVDSEEATTTGSGMTVRQLLKRYNIAPALGGEFEAGEYCGQAGV